MYTKITYDVISQKQKITGICGVCGKKKSRIIKEENTINPFNKNPDGTMKNRLQVNVSVGEDLRDKIEKLKQKYICYSCYENFSYQEKIGWEL